MNEREGLVEELEKIEVVYDHGEDGMSKPQNLLVDEIEAIADFILADRKNQEDKMRGMFEAEIEKVKDHIMFLLPMAKGYAYPTNIKANLEMIENAEEFIKPNAD